MYAYNLQNHLIYAETGGIYLKRLKDIPLKKHTLLLWTMDVFFIKKLYIKVILHPVRRFSKRKYYVVLCDNTNVGF